MSGIATSSASNDGFKITRKLKLDDFAKVRTLGTGR